MHGSRVPTLIRDRRPSITGHHQPSARPCDDEHSSCVRNDARKFCVLPLLHDTPAGLGSTLSVRITKRVASCATKRRSGSRSSGCSGTPATRCCPRPAPRTRCSHHVPAGRASHRHRLAEQGPRRDLRPGRAAGRAGLRRRAAPRRADGERPRRARRDLRAADRARHHQRLRARRGRRDRPGDYPDALALLEDLAAAGQAVRARRHHRLPGVAPDDRRRPDRPVDVGQAPPRDPHRQQPDLRPRGRRDWVHRLRARGITLPLLLGLPGPGRPHQAARRWRPRSASGSRPGSWPRTSGSFARPRRSRRLHRRAVPGAVRAGARRPRARWSRACTSSRSTRSPRPRPGAVDCSSGSGR